MSTRHVMIMASAGSGKTYALTDRFVALLAAGAAPERIVALTFTRKAAGEFFDEILKKLARAATDRDFAANLARVIRRPELRPEDFSRLLRAVVDAMPRLRLGTLDSFFARIARAFPLELGLTGDFEVLQPHAVQLERRRVMRRMFASLPGGLDPAQREFIEAFKRATYGTEEKRLAARLDGFLDEYYEVYLAAPLAAIWGEATRIWPGGCEWLVVGDEKLVDAIASLRGLLALRPLSDKQVGRFEAFFSALPEWTAGSPLPRAIEYVVENALEVWSDLLRGRAEMTVERKKVALDQAESGALVRMVRRVVGAELARRLEMTRGIHAVLRAYDTLYHEAVRRAGRLTFGDVQRLLEPDSSGRLLAGGGEAAAGRLMIDYRLDGQFDHWLLDEFQDTSFGQWSVLRNLIDEAVQDPTGGRSFFCVGDVKQAIYTWRGGDPGLFREVYAHYNQAAPGSIEERFLAKSFRSAPAIIEMVNAVFGSADALAELFPGAASAQWNAEWKTHESGRTQVAGQAAWLQADDPPARFALTVQILQEIDPLSRGLECVVLVRTNATATALADYLRREGGMPALAESDLRVASDNPIGTALLALIQAAAHPGDTLAKEHLAMTPLGDLIRSEGIGTSEDLTERVLSQIHHDGFERTMEHWLHRIEACLEADDEFSRVRSRQILVAAAAFDATGSRSAAEFVAFMERHAAADVDVSGVVKVMTVHKAKGLGFDVVVLPDLEGQRIDQRREGLAIEHDEERAVKWVLDLPPKLFYAQDEVLSAHVRAAEADACHEALSLLYVAMTRAKRAMYVITKFPGKSESRNYPKLLAAVLGEDSRSIQIGGLTCAGGWAAGEPRWFEGSEGDEPLPLHPTSGDGARDVVIGRRAARRPARRPSEGKAGSVRAAELFALNAAPAEFGIALHRTLAAIEWSDDSDIRLQRAGDVPADVLAEARACLASPQLQRVWARPEHGEVWRERAFEIVLDDAWITGVFDRVVVVRDASGAARRVTVFDFKTERVPSATDLQEGVQRHAGQMNLYRRVAAALAGVSVAAVTCELVFTVVPACALVLPAANSAANSPA